MLKLRNIGAQIETGPGYYLIAQLRGRSTPRDRLFDAQQKDVEAGRIKDKVKSGVETPYQILKDGTILLGI